MERGCESWESVHRINQREEPGNVEEGEAQRLGAASWGFQQILIVNGVERAKPINDFVTTKCANEGREATM